VGNVLIFRIPNGAVEEANVNTLIRKPLHISILKIQGHRPKEDIGDSGDIKQLLMGIHHSHIATATGRTPIKGKLQFSHNLSLPAFRITA
jgi:hypothetical protein